jgi:TonB family protein
MPSILVVEQENRYVDQIQEALASEGYKVRVVASQAAALQAAASEAPDLVVVNTSLPGLEAVASSFSRSAGGPGVVALLDEDAAPSGTGGVEADEMLAKPFSGEELLRLVRRLLTTRREPAPAVPVVGTGHKLTSAEIFGDMLAEVESEVVTPAPPKAGRPLPPHPLLPPLPPNTAPRPLARADDEMQRKLEQTLSGVLGTASPSRSRPAPPPPAAPSHPKRAEETDDDLDALISRTLSSLEMGRPAARPAPPAISAASAASAAPKPAPPTAMPPRPAPPAPAEGTGVRRPAKPGGDIDMAELEELARPRRKPAAEPAPPQPAMPQPAKPAAITAAPRPPAPAPPRPAPTPPAPPAVSPPVSPVLPVLPISPISPISPVSLAPAISDMATTQRIQVVDGQQPGERFGQYTLQEKIAVGGMAEVWKARMRGVEGFQKTVAIKKILPHMGDNADFVSMFIDEAKLAAQLSHPNIIHIYDLGKIGRDYYIAMEYVEGKDLRSILNAARRRSLSLPLGLALLIAARLASALDYAHRKRDFDDRELGLVHRDVSPQNVLITFEGDIKLCDFGIAKAVSKANQTQMGALKGKLQYMSPEQAWGKNVDARSDIFSLGAILFEMLTGERLFPGDSEMSILEAVRDGRTRRARSVLPSVPPEVDELVEKALAQDPAQRYQSASEMQGRIETVLHGLKPMPSHTDLAAYMHRLLSTDAANAAHAAHAVDAAVPEPLGAMIPELPELPPPPPMPPPPIPIEVPAPAPAGAAEGYDTPLAPPVEAVAPLGEMRVEEGERKGRTLLYAAIVAALVLGVVLYFVFGRKAAPPAPAAAPSAQAPGSPATPAMPATPAPLPATATGALGAVSPRPAKLDISGMVDQEVAKHESEIRKQLEDKKKQLERELAQAKAAGGTSAPSAAAASPGSAATASANAPASPAASLAPRPAVEMPAEPARTEPAVSRPEIPAPKAEEPPPAQAPASPPAPPATAPTRPAPEPAAAPSPATRAGDLVVSGPGVFSPELVSFSKPEYPPVARRMGVEGTVVVSVLVDENGRVEDAKLLTPIAQNVGINEAAVRAARGAHYRPALKGGVRVKMWTRLKIPFKL